MAKIQWRKRTSGSRRQIGKPFMLGSSQQKLKTHLLKIKGSHRKMRVPANTKYIVDVNGGMAIKPFSNLKNAKRYIQRNVIPEYRDTCVIRIISRPHGGAYRRQMMGDKCIKTINEDLKDEAHDTGKYAKQSKIATKRGYPFASKVLSQIGKEEDKHHGMLKDLKEHGGAVGKPMPKVVGLEYLPLSKDTYTVMAIKGSPYTFLQNVQLLKGRLSKQGKTFIPITRVDDKTVVMKIVRKHGGAHDKMLRSKSKDFQRGYEAIREGTKHPEVKKERKFEERGKQFTLFKERD